MHELSIVFSIAKRVEEVAMENNAKRVVSVQLDIGEVSTIIPSYLKDCWKWVAKKTPILNDCKLHVHIIKGVTTCNSCLKEYSTVTYGRTCPYCGSEDTVLKTGNQVEIRDIEVI